MPFRARGGTAYDLIYTILTCRTYVVFSMVSRSFPASGTDTLAVVCVQENWSLEQQLREEKQRCADLLAERSVMCDALQHADMESKELHG